MSQRITKEVASAVASALLAKKKEELKELKTSLSELITSVYLSKLPDGLLKFYSKHKKYFHQSCGIYISGVGISPSYRTYCLTENYPQPNGNKTEYLILNDLESQKVIDFNNQIENKEREISELRNGIEIALYNLRTYANVEKEFPEAFKLLPPSKVNTALAINIKDIRCKLDKANC